MSLSEAEEERREKENALRDAHIARETPEERAQRERREQARRKQKQDRDHP